jgi:hypothetical protein
MSHDIVLDHDTNPDFTQLELKEDALIFYLVSYLAYVRVICGETPIRKHENHSK